MKMQVNLHGFDGMEMGISKGVLAQLHALAKTVQFPEEIVREAATVVTVVTPRPFFLSNKVSRTRGDSVSVTFRKKSAKNATIESMFVDFRDSRRRGVLTAVVKREYCLADSPSLPKGTSLNNFSTFSFWHSEEASFEVDWVPANPADCILCDLFPFSKSRVIPVSVAPVVCVTKEEKAKIDEFRFCRAVRNMGFGEDFEAELLETKREIVSGNLPPLVDVPVSADDGLFDATPWNPEAWDAGHQVTAQDEDASSIPSEPSVDPGHCSDGFVG